MQGTIPFVAADSDAKDLLSYVEQKVCEFMSRGVNGKLVINIGPSDVNCVAEEHVTFQRRQAKKGPSNQR